MNAHAAFRRVDSEDRAEAEGRLGDRVRALENWRWFISGGLAIMALILGSGTVVGLVELALHK